MKYRLALALLLSASAHAQTVGIHTVSVHENEGYNNVNPGLYLRLDNGVTLGTLRNSESRQSVYVGYTAETPAWHALRAAVTVGGITGYRAAPVMPLVVPSVAYEFAPTFRVRLGYIPRPPVKNSSSALSLMFEMDWSKEWS
jgi:hypothetical protein